MILPATQSILNTNFRGRDRAIAFGIWGSVIGGVAAVSASEQPAPTCMSSNRSTTAGSLI